MKRVLLTATLLAMTGVLAHAQTSAVPSLINYQGKLTNQTGDPLATGEYDLTFRIWSDAHETATSPSNLLWVERYTSVPIVRGYFNVILGSGQAVTGFESRRDLMGAFTHPIRFISIEVETTDLSNEIKPRQQLLSTPFAFYALHGVPVGTVVPYLGSQATPPEGWLFCDGAEIPDEPKNSVLRAHIMSQPGIPTTMYDPLSGVVRTPDLRSRFVLGGDGGNLGETGGAADHRHSVDIGSFNTGSTGGNYGHAAVTDNDGVVRTHSHTVDPPNTNTSTTNHVPPYMRFWFIIKL